MLFRSKANKIPKINNRILISNVILIISIIIYFSFIFKVKYIEKIVPAKTYSLIKGQIETFYWYFIIIFVIFFSYIVYYAIIEAIKIFNVFTIKYKNIEIKPQDRKSTRLHSSHIQKSRLPSTA